MTQGLKPCPFGHHELERYASLPQPTLDIKELYTTVSVEQDEPLSAGQLVKCGNPTCPAAYMLATVEVWNTRPIEDALRAELARLRAALDYFSPPFCPLCGPRVSIDEEGCCMGCGATTYLDTAPSVSVEHGGE